MLTQGARTSGPWGTSAERGLRGLGKALEQMLAQAQGQAHGSPHPGSRASLRTAQDRERGGWKSLRWPTFLSEPQG